MEVIYVDGGVTPIESVYCIYVSDKKKKVGTINENNNTNYAEYLAILYACQQCGKSTLIYSDSKSTVMDLQKDKSCFQQIHDEIKNLIKEKDIEVHWIPREKNKAGIFLEKRLSKVKRYLNSSTGWKKLTVKQMRNHNKKWKGLKY